GLEAISRGAREALLVERDRGACEALRGSVAKLGAGGQATVVQADALALLRAPVHGRFDIVFVDPPFAADAWDAVLAGLPAWLADDAMLYLEAPPGHLQALTAGWRLHREGRTRETSHVLLRRAVPGAGAAAD